MKKNNPTDAWQPFRSTTKHPWSNRLAAHLYRRAGFGGTILQINQAHESGLEATLDQLFDLQDAESFDKELATAGRLVTGGNDSKALAAWWLLRMVQTPCPLLEKMTLFWHGHFATGADKVNDARAMLRQNKLLRKHALSKFQPLVKELSRDVAMLVYLDSTENRKTRPNENYARELMELFCLGPGNYTEVDIKEIARCFTGWEVRRNKFKFNAYQHDTGTKKFLGVSGKFDGDDAIEKILDRPAAANFIAKSLIRFFVFDEEQIDDELAAPLARCLADTDFDIAIAVKKIFSSQLFYSEQAVAKKIKSPVELAIGFLRFFDASVNMQQLSNRLLRLGQLPLYPPNVKGWDGGRSWINASTILARANLIDGIVHSSKTKYAAGSLSQWFAKNANESNKSLQWIDEYLLAGANLSDAKNVASKQTDALVNQFDKDPADAISWLASLPEFQLN